MIFFTDSSGRRAKIDKRYFYKYALYTLFGLLLILLIISLFSILKIGGLAGQEELVLSENLLNHSLSFNRVVFSVARLLSHDGGTGMEDKELDTKIRLCRDVLGHASVVEQYPVSIREDFFPDDPLLLLKRNQENKAEYDSIIGRLTMIYTGIENVPDTDTDRKRSLVADFEAAAAELFDVLQDRSFILNQLEEYLYTNLRSTVKELSGQIRFYLAVHLGLAVLLLAALVLYIQSSRKYETELRAHRDHLSVIVDKQTERLRRRNAEMEAVFKVIPDIFLRLNRNGTIKKYFAGESVRALFSLDDIAEMNIQDLFPPEASSIILTAVIETLRQNRITTAEFELVTGRKNKIFEARFVPLDGESLIAIIRDITEQKEYEGQIKKSLMERETLLKEIHHRVKNNLSMIKGMIELQLTVDVDEQVGAILQDLSNRIQSIVIVHEKLYLSKSLSKINFEEYIRELLDTILFSSGADKIECRLDIENVFLLPDAAIPLGLIISEFTSNALKYGFPDRKEGRITIELRREGDRYILTFENDGLPFPPDVDIHNSKSLGLNLVTALTAQLHGKLELERSGGTRFTIQLPVDYIDQEAVKKT
jgi:two-component sensor histidine kinase